MRVILEIQHAVNTTTLRGVGNYAYWLTLGLLHRHAYDYELSFFTNGYENIDRRKRAKKLFGDAEFLECSSLDYSLALRDERVFKHRAYEDYIGGTADLIHFMNIISIPTNIKNPMLVSVHDLNWIYHKEACSPIIHKLVRIGWNRVKKMRPFLVANSENTKQEILANSDYKEDEVAVIYHGYDKANCYPHKNTKVLKQLGINGKYLFFIGVFERKKNIVNIIKAFNLLAKNYKDLELVLAGKPTWDNPTSIYEEISNSPFRDRIILPGYVSKDIKRALYSEAEAFLFPSICEGFGVPLLEAFACGCPVVTSEAPALREVGEDAAFYANAQYAEDIAAKTEKIISNQEVRQTLVQKGLARAKVFSWDKTVEQTEKLYAKILSRG